MTTAHTLHAAPATSTAGMLLSLANCLPRHAAALRRRANALASKLDRPHNRAVDDRAAALLAELLTLADGDLDGFAEPDCLDGDFDAL